VSSGDYKVCNSIWLLDDFTTENGATRIVPGTHRTGKLPSDAMDDPNGDHSDQIQVQAKAGTVVIFNSHTWHGGVLNKTSAPRRAMHSYFCRSDQSQQVDQRKHLHQETIARLSPQARVILDVEVA
jgi:ectoine hydroxylase-related dioxygenase (phytanoyl-CoA dioxygenase family)